MQNKNTKSIEVLVEHSLASRIKDKMIELELNQSELAVKASVSKGWLSEVLANKYQPKQKNLKKLAVALNCSCLDLDPSLKGNNKNDINSSQHIED